MNKSIEIDCDEYISHIQINQFQVLKARHNVGDQLESTSQSDINQSIPIKELHFQNQKNPFRKTIQSNRIINHVKSNLKI